MRKGTGVGALLGNIRGAGKPRIIQEEGCEVMVISDDSNPDTTNNTASNMTSHTANHNGSIAAVLSPESLAKFGVVAEIHTLQNGTSALQTKEFVVDKMDIHNPSERTLKRIDKEQCNSVSRSVCEEIVISDATEKDDSREPIEDQDETPVLPPKYKFANPLMALNYMAEFKTLHDNFTKGCKWSPDGSCLLVTANDSKIRLFNLPTPVVHGQFQCESWFAEEAEKYTKPAVIVREKEIVYDYCWYPLMRSDLPSSCCFATTCKDHPIHLWDAWDGSLICSYNPYNHLDEMVAAYSVEFNVDGSRLVTGFNKCLRAFYTQRPGRVFDQIEAKNQPGIISCMSFNPQLPSVFAAGSYLGSIGLYNLERNNLFCRMEGNIGGVTQVKFSSCGTKLFSGSRKNNEILCWDIRNPGKLLCGYGREVSTSQRIYFDLEQHYSRFLVTREGVCCIGTWKTTKRLMQVSPRNQHQYSQHTRTVPMDIHPYCPLLATSSGQRHFPEPVPECDLDSCSESEEPEVLFTRSRVLPENTVKLWWLGES
ncbi:Telomerase Cajal body protein 1 [Portunus trituberculatus]|uniref:WD repeat-containing protein 79 n=1 Tax=Portunus trituberculatus TaxID=210409 RepID=A0A5B7D595_PORTR|nr:Telomerase Cajal body protein 1 [Portunus trituberculatus]